MNDIHHSKEPYMKIIEHYLDSLETYLPDEIKQDVRDELKASLMGQIEDSEEALGRELNLEETEDLLRKLGHPMQVASAYLPNQQLIGPELFPAYRKAIEIALALAVVITVLFSLLDALSGHSIIGVAIKIFANIVDNGIYVFAIVTLIFYLMEHYNADLTRIYAWSPKDLKPNSKRLKLSRLETGFELVASVLFIAFWNNIIPIPGQTLIGGEPATVSLSQEWRAVFWSVNMIMGLSIAIGVYNFLLATWNRFSLSVEIILSLATLVIVGQILQFDQFITLHSQLDENLRLMRFIAHIDNVVYSIIIIVAGISLWDIFSNFRKLRS